MTFSRPGAISAHVSALGERKRRATLSPRPRASRMGMGRAALCAWCLLAHLCHTDAQTAVSHVLVLHDNPSAKADDVIGVLKKLGVSAEQGAALVEEVSSKGSAVIVAGSQESCEQVSKLFVVIKSTYLRALGVTPCFFIRQPDCWCLTIHSENFLQTYLLCPPSFP